MKIMGHLALPGYLGNGRLKGVCVRFIWSALKAVNIMWHEPVPTRSQSLAAI